MNFGRIHRGAADFSIRRFVAVAGASAWVLSLLVLMALTLVGAGHLAEGSRFSLGLACLLVGLGFSSWLFEDCGMRR